MDVPPSVFNRRVIPAHLRFCIINKAKRTTWFDYLDKGASVKRFLCFGFDPNPAESIYSLKKIFSSFLFPTFYIWTVCMQMSSKSFAASTATGAGSIVSIHCLKPSFQEFVHIFSEMDKAQRKRVLLGLSKSVKICHKLI